MNRIARFLPMLLLCLVAACRFESDQDLYAHSIPLTYESFFGETQKIVLESVSNPGKDFLFLTTVNNEQLVARSDLKTTPLGSYSKVRLISDNVMAKGVYLLVGDAEGGGVHYYAFAKISDSEFALLVPKKVTKITNYHDIRMAVADLLADETTWARFKVLNGVERSAKWAKFVSTLQEGDTPAQDSTSGSNTPSASSTGLRLEDLDVGEGIYVQGIFSDELVQISRIDLVNRRVKVLRKSDGTGMWVAEAELLSREQSTVNDIGRVAVGVGLMVCLFDPEACSQ